VLQRASSQLFMYQGWNLQTKIVWHLFSFLVVTTRIIKWTAINNKSEH